MKKCYTILLMFLVSSCYIYGQIWPKLSWYKTYNGPGDGVDIVRDVKFQNGNLYLAGMSAGPDLIPDIFILEYSDKGDSVLGIRYSAISNSAEDAASIAIDSAGNIYIAGSSTFEQSTFYAFLLKYSPAGNLIFKKYFNSDININSEGEFVVLGSNGDPVFGYTQWDNGQSAKIAKYSSSGDSVWTVTFTDDTSSYFVNYLLTDQADNIYAALKQLYSDGSDTPATKTVAAKINKQGEVIWQTPVAGDDPQKMLLDKEKNIVLITQGDGRTIKFDPDGNVLWTNDYNNSEFPITILTGLVIDHDNNIVVSGYKYGTSSWNYRTKKLSPAGEEIWSNDFESMEGLNDFAMDLAIDSSDNLYVTGESHDQVSVGMCYTVKYSKDGGQGWVFKFDPPNSTFETPKKLFIGDSNFIYIGGDKGEPGEGPDFLAFKIGYGRGNDVKQIDKIPGSFSLSQNYPNPFNPVTKIDFSIPKGDDVKLEVYDALGRLVDKLINKYLSAGSYSIDFNGSNLPSGIYFYRLTSGSFVQMKKAVLLK